MRCSLVQPGYTNSSPSRTMSPSRAPWNQKQTPRHQSFPKWEWCGALIFGTECYRLLCPRTNFLTLRFFSPRACVRGAFGFAVFAFLRSVRFAFLRSTLFSIVLVFAMNLRSFCFDGPPYRRFGAAGRTRKSEAECRCAMPSAVARTSQPAFSCRVLGIVP